MQTTQKQYDCIKRVLPVQRSNVRIDNFTFLRAMFYIAGNGCKWRKLPEEFGNWHTIYMRMSRWAKNGVWQRINEALLAQLFVP
jgi:transposase